MNRKLIFLNIDSSSSAQTGLQNCLTESIKHIYTVGDHESKNYLVIKDALEKYSLQITHINPEQICDASPNAADIFFICCDDANEVSEILHLFINVDATIIAPVTVHHFSKRTIFMMSIPKSGTHMLIRLFDLWGMKRSSDLDPQPGSWSTPVGYEYHAPCKELLSNDWYDPVGKTLFFRSPAIFMYRNPLDIVTSELRWFNKPDNAFSNYLSSFDTATEQLERLISDETVMGTLRDRINKYTGWINFKNVIPVSYEELVGSNGGGDDQDQIDTIWSLQLKLHIPGNPQEYSSKLYSTSSATFSKGQIGSHKEVLCDKHYQLLKSLDQDFMTNLGYSITEIKSAKYKYFRQRKLAIKNIPHDLLYEVRLVRENLIGWNIVKIAGLYFALPQSESINSSHESEKIVSKHTGYVNLHDAERVVLQKYVESSIDSIQDTLTLLHNSDAALKGSIDDLQNSDARLQNSINDLHNSDAGLQNSITDLHNSDAGLQNSITDLHNSDSILQNSIIDLHNSDATLQNSINDLQNSNTTLQNSINDLQNSNTTLQKLITNLEKALIDLQSTMLETPAAEGKVYDDYLGFNIYYYNGNWYGLNRKIETSNSDNINQNTLEELRNNDLCIFGNNAINLKIGILRLYLHKRQYFKRFKRTVLD